MSMLEPLYNNSDRCTTLLSYSTQWTYSPLAQHVRGHDLKGEALATVLEHLTKYVFLTCSFQLVIDCTVHRSELHNENKKSVHIR